MTACGFWVVAALPVWWAQKTANVDLVFVYAGHSPNQHVYLVNDRGESLWETDAESARLSRDGTHVMTRSRSGQLIVYVIEGTSAVLDAKYDLSTADYEQETGIRIEEWDYDWEHGILAEQIPLQSKILVTDMKTRRSLSIPLGEELVDVFLVDVEPWLVSGTTNSRTTLKPWCS